ncbi:hypothetical protein [Hymenobacter sp. BRD67]|uniref:hypothetical protein n=1 Tax=Hymenobacter sp. BRD67 TaxID=2675877 RepID=UPI001563C17F|nr:hypothetical protein [Hymenobacter sp. BRD67]QKG54060.1 hypothetical protein GKZ67_17465 [Hymenobacter sp. BRD67]
MRFPFCLRPLCCWLTGLLLAPAFQGKPKIIPEEVSNLSNDKHRAQLQRNSLAVIQTLSSLSASGRELATI